MVSKFRLLMTTDVKSEVWDYSLVLSRALLKYINAEITLVSFGGTPTDIQKAELEDLDIKIKFTDFPAETGEDAENSDLKTFLEAIVKDFSPHIIHLNHIIPDVCLNIPCVLNCHSNLLNINKADCLINRFNPVPKRLENFEQNINKNLNSADAIITQSRFIAECLVKKYEFKKGIRVIYNGIEGKPYFGMPESPTLIACGDLSDRSRNIGMLINIAYKLPDNIKIKIIGDVLQYRKLPKNVEFLRNLSASELRHVYKNSSIYLALSNSEIDGLSAIQAAYSGCAILANDMPVFKELWGDCAYIFEKNNINSLMRCINNLVENKNILEATSRNCQAKALSVFNSRRMAYEYINLYKDVLRKRQVSGKTTRESLNKLS